MNVNYLHKCQVEHSQNPVITPFNQKEVSTTFNLTFLFYI